MRQKEALKAGLIRRVNITLDRETIAWFKAEMGKDGETGGTGWLEMVAQTLRDHARADADRELLFVASGGLNPPATTRRKTPATSPVFRKHGAPADSGGYCRYCADEMLVRSFRPLTGGRRKKGNRQQRWRSGAGSVVDRLLPERSIGTKA